MVIPEPRAGRAALDQIGYPPQRGACRSVRLTRLLVKRAGLLKQRYRTAERRGRDWNGRRRLVGVGAAHPITRNMGSPLAARSS
jgi:hypothetical protein